MQKTNQQPNQENRMLPWHVLPFRIETYNRGEWKMGRYCVISDKPEFSKAVTIGGADEIDYYGGHLIGESINHPNMKVIIASKKLFELCKSIENDNKQIPKFIWDEMQELLFQGDPAYTKKPWAAL